MAQIRKLSESEVLEELQKIEAQSNPPALLKLWLMYKRFTPTAQALINSISQRWRNGGWRRASQPVEIDHRLSA